MALYASEAPFGSNVVGLDAASWRYFGRSPEKLSWGEMASLAVLPNAPALVHPGKNREVLIKKRNALLDKLLANKIMDQSTCYLAKLEPLPGEPVSLTTTCATFAAAF
jgi:penicillin-binding protein 1C